MMTTVAKARLLELQTDTATGNSMGGAPASDGSAEKAGPTSADGQPLYPPAPVIGHLTNDEIDALNDVFSRMELFEAEESARIRY